MKISGIDDLKKMEEAGLQSLSPEKTKISVGMATCGLATGAGELHAAIDEKIKSGNLDVVLSKTGCFGLCSMEPIMNVLVPGKPLRIYSKVTPKNVGGILDSISAGKPTEDNLFCECDEPESVSGDFFDKQKKIVLRNCGFIRPDSIEEYVGRGGYRALFKAVDSMSPGQVIEEVKSAGLRGRGGAGFPTGLKWEFCRKAEGEPKYVVCNADEGDPGAYMDRSVLEGDPHAVLEGMLIGAYAIGARHGIVYVRTEYPLAIEQLQKAIASAREAGLLGEGIFGKDFSFDIEIREGSGAFVCGEETALIHSIEAVPADPRQRPPFPAQSGLWGKPTNINNVETWANVSFIISQGSEAFSGLGTEKSKGTKVFSLVGKIENTGLVEVPMGISLKEIIYDIGQGIPEGKKLKGVQTGGPSGGCIPAEHIETPVDYEKLGELGSIMGSGGMIVMDEDTCVVDLSKFFLSFTKDESCGKCTACREGSEAMLEVLTRISDGEGTMEDLTFLEELGAAVKLGSLCGLGQTLPNPVLSTLKHFRAEYEAHVKEKRCPALVCTSLIKFYIDEEKCIGCGACAKQCPVNAIKGQPKYVHVIDQELCTKCGGCLEVCPKKASAVTKVSGEEIKAPAEPVPVKQ